MPPKKLLLATDLSCRSDRALDRAAALASGWGARLVVLHALQELEHVTDAPSWRLPPDPREVAERRVRDDLRGADGIDLQVIVEKGDPAQLAAETAFALGCEVIVTGVARSETLGRMLLGTTVDKIVRRSDVPVLIVKSRPRGPYRSVVVATDFSDTSRVALEVTLALLPDAEVSLFHAFDPPFENFVTDKMALRRAGARAAAAESAAFLAATPSIARSGRTIRTICESGPLSWSLTDLAQAGRVDLVALGTRGRGGIAGALLGSVAERLINDLPLDMLVVPRAARRERSG